MRAVRADFDCELIAFNGKSDHVHLPVNFPPKDALSKLVNSLEGMWHYWRVQRLWSGSYFAGSVGGAPISVLRQYIERQQSGPGHARASRAGPSPPP